MTISEILTEKGREEGLEKGLEKGRLAIETTAINLIKMGMLTAEQIAEATQLPLKRIEELSDQ